MAIFTLSFLIASLCIILCNSSLDNKTSTEWEAYFDHHTFLRPTHDYRLYWKLLSNSEIEIGLEVETTGWIAFGISNDRSMADADIIMGWIHEKTTYLQRRHSVSLQQRYPVFDKDLSHKLIHAEQVNGVTRIHFVRSMYPCADEDYPFAKKIVIGTTFALFAYHSEDPICSDPERGETCAPLMHNKLSMGSESINFQSGESAVVEMPEIYSSFKFIMNSYSLPSHHHTTYHCKFIQLPAAISSPHHMIRVDPIIQSGNEAAVHHIILYWCAGSVDAQYRDYEADCDSFANMPHFEGRGCKSQGISLAGWAVGAGNFYLPKHVGLPMEGFQFALLEIHYDNPGKLDNIIDNSGLEIYWTPQLRANDVGGFALFAPYVEVFGLNSQFIPGNMEQRVTNGVYSAAECSKNSGIPADGIHVISGGLHSHTIGVQMKLRHIRDNIELAPLLQNDNYDFNYQEPLILSQEVTVLPGDELICECVYDSNAREYPTYGGESTRDEMCVCSIAYYPAIEGFGGAASYHTNDEFEVFFATAIENGWFNGTNNMSTNLANKDNFYYDSGAEGAFEHYLQFQQQSNREVVCEGCPNFVCSDYIVPEMREEFVAYEAPNDCLMNNNRENNENEILFHIILYIIGGIALLLIIIVIIVIIVIYRKRKTYNAVHTNNDDVLPGMP